jgi:hypothetical protein
VSVVRKVTQRQQGGELAGNQGDDDLLDVDLRDESLDRIADLELLRGDGGRQGLTNGSDEPLCVRVELGDSDGDGFADVEDVRQVRDEVLANQVRRRIRKHSIDSGSPCFRLRDKRP